MSATTPTVSVVLTTYNQARWLREAIDSVLQQTFEDWELLVVDNGSTDNTPEVLNAYQDDSRVIGVRHERNLPHTVISNRAINESRGRYVSFLYGDDYYLPQKLARQVAAFDQLPEKYGVVYCAGYRLGVDGQLIACPCSTQAGDVLEALLKSAGANLFLPIAPLVRRECLLRYPFNEGVFIEGEGIFQKIAFSYHFSPLPEPLVVMRDHQTNLAKEVRSNLERNIFMLNALFAHPEFPPRLRHLRGRLLAEKFRLGGWQMIRRKRDYDLGRRWLQDAIAHDTTMRRDPRVLAGLTLARMPRWMANAWQNAIDGWKGAPPPVPEDSTPVTGIEGMRNA